MTPGDLFAEAALRSAEAALLGAPLLVAAALGARLARRSPSALRHALWTGALAAQAILLGAPGLAPTIAVPGWPDWAADPVRREAVAVADPVPVPSIRDLGATGTQTASGKRAGRTAAADGVDGATDGSGPTGLLLGWLWAAGAIAALLPLVAGLLARRRWMRGAVRGPPCIEREVLRRAPALGIRRRIRVRVGGGCTSPVTWGLLRPVLLLPRSALDWPEERLRVVLLHELAHVRRLDACVRAVAEGLSVILWFDPLVWLARRGARTAGEAAADDAVLSAGVRPSLYVEELVAVARDALGRLPAASHCALGAGTPLRRRAEAILVDRGARRAARPGTTLLAAGCAALVALPLATFRGIPGYAADLGRPSASSCRHEGGRHLDRLVPDGDADVWIVEWEGEDCRVAVRARGPVAFEGDLSDLASVAADGLLSIRVRNGSGTIGFTARGEPDGRLRRTWRVDGEVRPFDATARAWLGRFLIELDRHTAFAAGSRLPRLLAAGGPELVLEEAARSQGGHAGGIYLHGLVQSVPLTDVQVARVLLTAARVSSADAVMAELLRAVRERYDPRSPVIARAWSRAVETLQAEAARDAVA